MLPSAPHPAVELVFDADCPNVDAAREVLRAALVASGFAPEWREWVRGADGTPDALQAFGSPTILVNGRDVAPLVRAELPQAGSSCRMYADERGTLLRAPPLGLVVRALVRPLPA